MSVSTSVGHLALLFHRGHGLLRRGGERDLPGADGAVPVRAGHLGGDQVRSQGEGSAGVAGGNVQCVGVHTLRLVSENTRRNWEHFHYTDCDDHHEWNEAC